MRSMVKGRLSALQRNAYAEDTSAAPDRQATPEPGQLPDGM
jgi:hypothetical protein